MLSLLFGTPVLSLIGAIGAALTLGLRGGGALLALLVLPLYVPVPGHRSRAAEAAVSGLGGQAQLLLLGALLVFAAAFAALGGSSSTAYFDGMNGRRTPI